MHIPNNAELPAPESQHYLVPATKFVNIAIINAQKSLFFFFKLSKKYIVRLYFPEMLS